LTLRTWKATDYIQDMKAGDLTTHKFLNSAALRIAGRKADNMLQQVESNIAPLAHDCMKSY